jgi:hypothetical protein
MPRWTLLFILLGLLSGCLETQNSSSGDAAFAPDEDATPEFQAVRLILSQECAGCHSYHEKSEAQLIANGDVEPGDANHSKLYNRLQGSTGAGDPSGGRDMPQNDSISLTDVETIETWINGITP